MRVLPDDVEIHVRDGETLFDAALREGWGWPTNCYGQTRCTACHVTIVAGGEHLARPDDEEATMLERLANYAYASAPTASRRLACRTRPAADLIVELRTPLSRRE